MDADRKSSVILEADRSQIPIVSSVDSNIPLGSYKRITYPIPANDPIQFVYLFRNSITKTVLLERGRIVAMKETAGEETTHRSTFSKKNLLSSVGSRSIDPVLVTVPVRVVVATVVRLSRAGGLGCSRCLGFVWLVGHHKDLASVRWFDRGSSWLALLACLDLL
ncbi:hypothetical protein Sjap_026680 [Stephania japonica]|uniref:Uncharacterized protein n=1 Tax=Stephania japonica TaxID=461633 RepID=A0AAP0DXZ8_9MAGN